MEDDSLLDDDTIIRETPPPPTVTPGTFSKNIIRRLGFSLRTGPETASTINNDSSYLNCHAMLVCTTSLHIITHQPILYTYICICNKIT